MDKIYHNIRHPAAFGGAKQLQRASKKSAKEVRNYLMRDKVYRKFRHNKKIVRARVQVGSIASCYQSDIFVFAKFSRYNAGMKYILLVVDTFSRVIHARAIKQKDAASVSAGLEEIFAELKQAGHMAPRVTLGTDAGLEYENRLVNAVYEKYNIAHFYLRAPIKAGMAELSGKLVAQSLYKHMFLHSTRKWIDVLHDAVHAKNNRYSPRLGMAPAAVSFDNQEAVYHRLYPNRQRKGKPIRTGTRVQIETKRNPFWKSYSGYFSDKVYRISHHNEYNGIFRYSLVDIADDVEIYGSFYANEILAMPSD